MKKPAISGNFRSAEYLEGLFQLAEGLVLDQRDKVAMGKRYRQALEWSGLSQRAFGDLLHMGDRQVRNYLEGNVDNIASEARPWAKATGVRYEWLLTGEGSPFPLSDDDRLGRIEELLEEMLALVRELGAQREADATRSAEGSK